MPNKPYLVIYLSISLHGFIGAAYSRINTAIMVLGNSGIPKGGWGPDPHFYIVLEICPKAL